ncbi:MAG: YchJ family metal-binding protein [Alphaproteobacteria bacterium]|nr:YchJ family metal-binding protein [Alphaproteobacteria bacterium]
MTQTCPCGRDRSYADCCGRFLDGPDRPEAAEELMRSRYTAYVLERIDYLRDTLWPRNQPLFDMAATARWAGENHWAGLTVIDVRDGGPADREGTVLFEARFLSAGQLHTHRECSRFKKKKGRWFYVEAVPE